MASWRIRSVEPYLKDTLSSWEVIVSLEELETAVADLPGDELVQFARWFEDYLADAWDRRIEEDIGAGRLDKGGQEADADFDAGRCKPL